MLFAQDGREWADMKGELLWWGTSPNAYLPPYTWQDLHTCILKEIKDLKRRRL